MIRHRGHVRERTGSSRRFSKRLEGGGKVVVALLISAGLVYPAAASNVTSGQLSCDLPKKLGKTKIDEPIVALPPMQQDQTVFYRVSFGDVQINKPFMVAGDFFIQCENGLQFQDPFEIDFRKGGPPAAGHDTGLGANTCPGITFYSTSAQVVGGKTKKAIKTGGASPLINISVGSRLRSFCGQLGDPCSDFSECCSFSCEGEVSFAKKCTEGGTWRIPD